MLEFLPFFTAALVFWVAVYLFIRKIVNVIARVNQDRRDEYERYWNGH